MAAEGNEKIVAVADSSFLIGISMIRQWGLLAAIVKKLYVAPTVWKEVVVKGQGRPASAEIQQADFIERHSVRNTSGVRRLQIFLNRGEAETLVLAQEIGCPIVFLNERRARKVAQSAGLQTMGVLGVLLVAKRKGFIASIRPLLESLLQQGFRLSHVLCDSVLREAGEL